MAKVRLSVGLAAFSSKLYGGLTALGSFWSRGTGRDRRSIGTKALLLPATVEVKRRAQHVRERRVGVGDGAALRSLCCGPLRLARLAGDDGDRVRRGRADDGLVEIVEQDEVLRPWPHERDGVAVEMAEVGLGLLLLRQGDRGRPARRGFDDGAAGGRRGQALPGSWRSGRCGDARAGSTSRPLAIPGGCGRPRSGRRGRSARSGRSRPVTDRLRHQEGGDGDRVQVGVEVSLDEARRLIGRASCPAGAENRPLAPGKVPK